MSKERLEAFDGSERSQLEKVEDMVQEIDRSTETAGPSLIRASSLQRPIELSPIVYHCRASIQNLVPVELWEKVFGIVCLTLHEYSFHTDFELEEVGVPDILETPTITLSQVCSRWRNIVKGSPRLWSSISVAFLNLPFDIIAPLTLHLDNSKAYPLKIRIARDADPETIHLHFPSPPPSENEQLLWTTLGQNLSRCGELSLKVTHFNFRELPDLSFPRLVTYREEAFVEYIGEESANGPPLWLLRAIGQAPHLASLMSWWIYSAEVVPYSRLTHIHIVCLDPDELDLLLQILRSCSKLEHLRLDGCFLPETFMPSEVVVSSLQVLILGDKEAEIPEDLLSALYRCLRLPSLVTFELTCDRWSSPLPLIGMLKMSSNTIQNLDLCVFASEDFEETSTHPLITLRRHLPRLVQFQFFLGRNHVDRLVRFPSRRSTILPTTGTLNALLHNLKQLDSSGHHTLLPAAQSISLEIWGAPLTAGVAESVLQVVASRRRASAPLKKFRCLVDEAEDPYVIDFGTLTSIEELEESGLEVILKSRTFN
ncbi:hypothetical protein PM082_021792 [Marasmius tenuissimus]|nr:hypothetical protein PM082_021792 [Marasmius tenuissimus]